MSRKALSVLDEIIAQSFPSISYKDDVMVEVSATDLAIVTLAATLVPDLAFSDKKDSADMLITLAYTGVTPAAFDAALRALVAAIPDPLKEGIVKSATDALERAEA